MNFEIDQIQDHLRRDDSFTFVDAMESAGAPLEVADIYLSVIKDLYWKVHDLAAVVLIGRFGIHFCLGQSRTVGVDPAEREKLRSAAKSLAYNVASFTWPGWEEPGIRPTSDQIAAGRDCARLNLRLAIGLNKPADKVVMAHWLIGAHALAGHDPIAALQDFKAALDVEMMDSESSAGVRLLCNGYFAIAQLAMAASNAGAQAEFDRIIEVFGQRTDADAKTYTAQLRAAYRLFAPANALQQ